MAWVRLRLAQQDIPVTTLVESGYAAFQGRVPDLDAALTAFAQVQADGEQVTVDPDTFDAIAPTTPTGHPYQLVMSRSFLAQIEAMEEHEAEALMRGLAKLADTPTPPGARWLA